MKWLLSVEVSNWIITYLNYVNRHNIALFNKYITQIASNDDIFQVTLHI